jgi:hypothetical protein
MFIGVAKELAAIVSITLFLANTGIWAILLMAP